MMNSRQLKKHSVHRQHIHHVGVRHHVNAPQQSSTAPGTVLWFLFVAGLMLLFWYLYRARARNRIKREAEAQAAAAASAAQEARAQQERLEAERARERSEWQQAETRAKGPIHTSLLLHPDEIVGFACQAHRVLTHKVGRETTRDSSRSGTSDGQSSGTSETAGSIVGGYGHGVFVGGSGSTSRSNGLHHTVHQSRAHGRSYTHDDIRTEVVDQGQLVITSQRVVFQGNSDSLDLDIDKIAGFHFPQDNTLVIDYAKRPEGECYILDDPLAMKMAVSTKLHLPGFEYVAPLAVTTNDDGTYRLH